MKVLLTVPHAGCFSSNLERHCDRNAKLLADGLAKALEKNEVEFKIIENHGLRIDYDANRESGYYSSGFGSRVDDALKSGEYDYVIDCHSYPDYDLKKPRHFYILDFFP